MTRNSVRRTWASFGLAALLIASLGRVAAAQQAAAPAGVRVYGCDVHDVTDADGGAAAITLVGAHNGGLSGKVVVASQTPIQSLKATAGNLVQGAAIIPASRIAIRFAVPSDPSNYSPKGPDSLLEAPLAEFPAGRVPIWITIEVPQDSKAGIYTGQITIEAKGLAATKVPVKLDVRDWTLPKPEDYRTWVDFVESPDTLAMEYNVPLWSDKHMELIGRSFRLLANTGDRSIYIPLIAHTNYGNAESMVRWIKKGDGKYDYDFTPLDKYLDVVAKNLGTPKVTLIHAWEIYMMPPRGTGKAVEIKSAENSWEWREETLQNSLVARVGKGPMVTTLDPATGKTDTMDLPPYMDPSAKAAWQPVWDGVRARLKQHGWEKSMMVGNMTDYWPSREYLTALSDLTGGLPWTVCCHNLTTMTEWKSFGKVNGVGDVGYGAMALGEYYNFNPAKSGHLYGWKQPILHVQYWRFQHFNVNELAATRTDVERLITVNKRGLGHIGADFWPPLRNKRGQPRAPATDRFPESYWHSLNVMGWMLAPGPQGAVGTTRLEILREGIQDCEARIAIETALSDDALKAKLGDDLAKLAQDYLDDRLVAAWKGVGVTDTDIEKYGLVKEYRTYYYDISKRVDVKAGSAWFIKSLWQDRDAKLFDLAGEVTRKIGK